MSQRVIGDKIITIIYYKEINKLRLQVKAMKIDIVWLSTWENWMVQWTLEEALKSIKMNMNRNKIAP